MSRFLSKEVNAEQLQEYVPSAHIPNAGKVLSSRAASESAQSTSTPLAILGLQQQTTRYIGPLEIATVGWSICISYVAIASTLSLVVGEGGPVTLLYGEIVVFATYGCIAATMAELASIYPTAGGQYHWTAILAPASCSRLLSYICGAINVFSWISVSAGVVIIDAQIILAIVIRYCPDYVPEAWHYFLLYQCINALVILHNVFTLRRTMWTFNVISILTLASFFVLIVTCLVRSESKQSNQFVWVDFINSSGWSDNGVAFLVGLVSPNYMYGGIDGAIHLAEECTNARTAVPRALMTTWIVGFVTTFTFSIAIMYTIADYAVVASDPSGFPVYELFAQATRSDTAATIFMVVMLVALILSLVGCEQTASRLTWSFARDNALVGSKWMGRMHESLEAPIWALLANGLVILIIGCIYLGSSTAFNAFISTGLILQLLSFAFPAALLIYRKRSIQYLPSNRSFKMPALLGWIANLTTVAFAVLCLVFYDFPTVMPLTSSNMNYACAVIGVMAIFALLNWFFWARTRFHGPTITV